MEISCHYSTDCTYSVNLAYLSSRRDFRHTFSLSMITVTSCVGGRLFSLSRLFWVIDRTLTIGVIGRQQTCKDYFYTSYCLNSSTYHRQLTTGWLWRRDSNSQPSPYQSDHLTIDILHNIMTLRSVNRTLLFLMVPFALPRVDLRSINNRTSLVSAYLYSLVLVICSTIGECNLFLVG